MKHKHPSDRARQTPQNPQPELELFRAAVADVTPHQPVERVNLRRPPPPARARQRELDEAAVMLELFDRPDPETFESGETLTYRGDGIQDSVWRKLRRGGFSIQAEIDLHGLKRDAARLAVQRFLTRCQDHDRYCVRIIHGKGNGSPNSGPVLKRLVDGWLRQQRAVLAFCSARVEDGGTGAVYVLLRQR